jgi:molybdenum cofactor guanylyltransferase
MPNPHPTTTPPQLNALILIGGKSTRMGTDKSEIIYHGIPQKEHLTRLFTQLGIETYLSTSKDYEQKANQNQDIIQDIHQNIGPLAGILAAFNLKPDQAWLVTACDHPHLDLETIQQLINNRDPTKSATAFQNPQNQQPEPLLTIYEPKAHPILTTQHNQGIHSPQHFLNQANIKLIHPENPKALININTQQEYLTIKTNPNP